ncbi:DUF2569 domain-containing protein [Devosia ginsengisoli]|nr:DUF2569 domain-containing protein [Devosia ginsengisoli]
MTSAELQEQHKRTETLRGPTGLGGWLILPALGLFATPVLAIPTFGDLLPLLTSGAGLTAAQMLVVWFELISNVVLQLLAPAVLLALFFQKKRYFPLLYAGWLAANLLIMLLDLVFVYNAFRSYYDTPGVVFWDQDTAQGIGRAVFGAAIWIPYMFKSVRVKNTFVN